MKVMKASASLLASGRLLLNRGHKQVWRAAKIPRYGLVKTRFFSDTKESAREIAKRIAAKNKEATGVVEEAASSNDGSVSILLNMAVAGALGGGLLWMSFTETGNNFANKYILDKNSTVGYFFTAARDFLMYPFTDQFEPSSDKLLPDFPPVPPGHVAHRTLVLDLEGTLCHSEWDRKNGWRAAKRPGLDKFLARMCQMYEIVIFSSGTFMTEEPLTIQLDPYHFVSHFLFRDSTLYQDGKYIKDLSKLNRDLSRVVVVEDEPEEVAFQPENVIKIKPFKDPFAEDNELEKLGDFLEDIFNRDVQDARAEIKKYGDDILDKFYYAKLERQKKEQEQRSRGLGGFIRRHGRQ